MVAGGCAVAAGDWGTTEGTPLMPLWRWALGAGRWATINGTLGIISRSGRIMGRACQVKLFSTDLIKILATVFIAIQPLGRHREIPRRGIESQRLSPNSEVGTECWPATRDRGRESGHGRPPPSKPALPFS